MPSLHNCADNEAIVSVTQHTVANLLSNIKEIHKLHIKLVAEFQQATEPFPYHTNCIGNIFLKYVSSSNKTVSICFAKVSLWLRLGSNFHPGIPKSHSVYAGA